MQVTPLLLPSEAAEMLRTSTAVLANWRNTKAVDIKYIKIGGAVRYKLEDIEAYINSNTHN